ncbi:MAG TPA: hypothetical protein VKN62_05720 [Pelovirga sp.]|nr:hypothetical protein [Pelovirga sp.]
MLASKPLQVALFLDDKWLPVTTHEERQNLHYVGADILALMKLIHGFHEVIACMVSAFTMRAVIDLQFAGKKICIQGDSMLMYDRLLARLHNHHHRFVSIGIEK